MKKILTLVALGAIAFGVVSAAAASLGTITSPGTLGAATINVDACGTQGSISVSYETVYDSGADTYDVDKIVLTAGSGSWLGSPTCVGQKASVTVDDASNLSDVSITDGTGTAEATAGTLTLDIANTDVTTFTNVAILVKP